MTSTGQKEFLHQIFSAGRLKSLSGHGLYEIDKTFGPGGGYEAGCSPGQQITDYIGVPSVDELRGQGGELGQGLGPRWLSRHGPIREIARTRRTMSLVIWEMDMDKMIPIPARKQRLPELRATGHLYFSKPLTAFEKATFNWQPISCHCMPETVPWQTS